MNAGFCLHCGLKMDGTADVGVVHAHCMPAYQAEQAAERAAPKTKMEQQLDRIEGLLMEIAKNTRKPYSSGAVALEPAVALTLGAAFRGPPK